MLDFRIKLQNRIVIFSLLLHICPCRCPSRSRFDGSFSVHCHLRQIILMKRARFSIGKCFGPFDTPTHARTRSIIRISSESTVIDKLRIKKEPKKKKCSYFTFNFVCVTFFFHSGKLWEKILCGNET